MIFDVDVSGHVDATFDDRLLKARDAVRYPWSGLWERSYPLPLQNLLHLTTPPSTNPLPVRELKPVHTLTFHLHNIPDSVGVT